MIELPQYLIDRFWSKVDKTSDPEGHWLWTGHIIPTTGYGTYARYLVHRLAYMLVHGDIPDGLFVLHKPPCNIRHCVLHLYAGTQRDNIRDEIAMGTYALGGKGDDNWQRQHPEDLKRGIEHHSTKITQEMVDAIQEIGSSMSRKAMARKFGIYPTTVTQIQTCTLRRADIVYKLPPNNRARGENHYKAKMTQEKADDMRTLYATGNWSQSELGQHFGVARSTAAGILRGEEWNHKLA
jgi:hypothetical protein